MNCGQGHTVEPGERCLVCAMTELLRNGCALMLQALLRPR